jgi:hypothetical protein
MYKILETTEIFMYQPIVTTVKLTISCQSAILDPNVPSMAQNPGKCTFMTVLGIFIYSGPLFWHILMGLGFAELKNSNHIGAPWHRYQPLPGCRGSINNNPSLIWVVMRVWSGGFPFRNKQYINSEYSLFRWALLFGIKYIFRLLSDVPSSFRGLAQ